LTIARFLLALLTLGAVGLTVRPHAADAYVAPSMEYGASVHVLGSPETTGRDLDALVAAGIGWAKIHVLWRSIERQNDVFDWSDLDRVVNEANARGIRLIARIDTQPEWSRTVPAENGPPDLMDDYADFVAQVVGRYGSARIPVIQIWNEPNLSREWGNAVIDQNQAAQYVYMLKLAHLEAKKKDPNITILNAGPSPTATTDGTAQPDDVYLQWLYAEGLAKYTDAIGLHGNSFGLPPEAPILSDPVNRPYAFHYFRRDEQLHDIMVANGDGAKQVWLMEFGYTSDTRPESPYAWHAVDENTKAAYIVQALQYAKANWAPWIAEMTLWTMADPHWTPADEQYYWAITEPDGTPRPTYNAIRDARASGALP
jgi:hypothetical protein